MTLPARRGRYATRRWDPFLGLPAVDELFDQMSRMLTNAFPDAARINIRSWSPPVNVEESDDAFLVEADVPGVSPDDVHIDLERNELRITGEYGTEQRDEEQQQPRRSGRFDYRVSLPGEVDAESCGANLENGVLHLRLPKATRGRQRIPVQSGPAQSSASAQAPDQHAEQGGATR
jgi:HSP20 family protein